jgi:hypothetical protein
MNKESLQSDSRSMAEKRNVERNEVFNTIGYIHIGLDFGASALELAGSVLNVSSKGCCIALKTDAVPDAYQFCRITIGQHVLVPSQVRWVREIGKNFYEIGFCYQV